MPSKRKRGNVLDFDPNRSDPEDENFEPGESRPRRGHKVTRLAKGKGSSTRGRRRNGYSGSDIEDDDEVMFDSEEENSFAGDDGHDDDGEDEDAPLNASGRRARKAAVKPNYKESSDEDDGIPDNADEDSTVDESKPFKHLVTLKVNTKALKSRSAKEPAAAPIMRRSTRARTHEAEEEFVELSNSGHIQPARSKSKSQSPETYARHTRPTRGSKGVKKLPSTIEEATQESSVPEHQSAAGAVDIGSEPAVNQPETTVNEDDENQDDGENPDAKGEDEEDFDVPKDTTEIPDAEDEDDMPITRRIRIVRGQASENAAAAEEADDESEKSDSGPSTRRKRLQKKKSTQEPSSDFEPGGDSDDAASGSDGGQKNGGDKGGADAEAGPLLRETRSTRSQARGTKRGRDDESADELDLDQDEIAEELEELRESSHSRRLRRRRQSPEIVYEPPAKRRRTKVVDYTIKPLTELVDELDEEPETMATPARGRRGGRNGGAGTWERNFNTTYGPFGGGGLGSLLGGPWGTGATGGVDSDSSDDEMIQRSGVAGNVGMTPTSAAPPGLLPSLGGAAPNVGKVKNQKAYADADPLGVDMNVDFSKIGGLQGHIDQLKEMVQLPLLYPELFQRFHVTPPRGVLFHGPPGTGKTLLARALANSIGHNGKKITFYMRKGADALSKWVGEAERQLRLLFEEARRTQPSIIFFDEIDGLAPVRSSKQEQIHASIVSTLLALMDGMDGRGQVIVIGATNRPDNIDPALRRPGRFDREFYFPLPDVEGRRAILDIHTKDWGISDVFKQALAENTKGYGGADLRSLTTEAALNAIQRTYPQIYSSKEKLVVDPDRIQIHATDFMLSIKKIIPSSERSAISGAAPLPKAIEPLLRQQLKDLTRTLDDILPQKKKTTALEEAMYEIPNDADHGFGRESLQQEFERARVFRPRLLIHGRSGMGQGYLSSAILHHFEHVHVQSFDLATLLGDGRPCEQVIVSLFTEVKRHKPSVIYIPNIDIWYSTVGDLVIRTFLTLLRSIPPTDPVLLLGTTECEASEIPSQLLRDFFGFSGKNRSMISRPSTENRLEFFSNIVTHIRKSPAEFPDPSSRKKRVLEELPVAPPPPPKPLSKEELLAQEKEDRWLLNTLKIRLQPVMDQIKKKYRKFVQPPIPYARFQYLFDESQPGYVRADIEGAVRPFEIDTDKEGTQGLRETATGNFFYNLDTVTIEERISNGYYARPKDFRKDIMALVNDAKNLGDRERLLKAREMESNVDVDMTTLERESDQNVWESLYQRQLHRVKEKEEKHRKKAALQNVVDQVQSDVGNTGGDGAQGSHMDARFQVMSPFSNGHVSSDVTSHQLSNGNSVPSRSADDMQMGSVDQMRPPSQWPHTELRPSDQSTRATAGNTQVSQVSAVTAIPHGMSPSAVVNEASTTKTSDPSTNRSLLQWNTQGTNGYHSQAGENSNSQLPDTQPLGGSGPSQVPSEEPWMHSQAHAMARGMIPPRTDFTVGMGSGQTSPSSSQVPPRKASVANLLNEPVADPDLQQAPRQAPRQAQQQLQQRSSSIRNSNSSAASSQPYLVSVDDNAETEFLRQLTDQTSGCSIEQLEQISRELMDEIWRTRHEWNRIKVKNLLQAVFNQTIRDMEDIQGLDASSQARDQDMTDY